jgi:cob(I)alamin adenosyltransferase
MRVGMLQFIKHSTANFGEHRAARKLGVEITPMGDGFTWLSKDMDVTKGLALQHWEVCKEKVSSGDYGLLIFDEITYAFYYEWLSLQELLEVLRARPPELHVIITGR